MYRLFDLLLRGIEGMKILTMVGMLYIPFQINSQVKFKNTLIILYYHSFYCQLNISLVYNLSDFRKISWKLKLFSNNYHFPF